MMASMTPVEFKKMEGARVLPGLAAIAALPGAGLVTGTGAGAPLFSAALVSVAMAYLLWLFTDNYYYRSILLKEVGLLEEWRPRLERETRWVSYGTLVFAGLTVLLTLMGFAGERSALVLPITVEWGFVVSLVYALGCMAYGFRARMVLKRLQDDVNAARLAAEAKA